MTLQEFINLHPNVIHYDRAGVEGIDLDALHERIQKSRYLKSRQSFLFFVKNYNAILSGYYDDFKLIEEEQKCPLSDTVVNSLKDKLRVLKGLNLSERQSTDCKEHCGYSPREAEIILEETLTKKFGQVAWAGDVFNRVKAYALALGV